MLNEEEDIIIYIQCWFYRKLYFVTFIRTHEARPFGFSRFIHNQSVWPDLAIFCTFGDFLKPLATISLLKSPTVLDNFCKGVKINHFSSEIIFGQFL